jgi:hypothetical protein
MVVKIAYQQETSCTLNMISAILIAVEFIANGMLGSGALALRPVEREQKMPPAPNWSKSLMEGRALAQILKLIHVTLMDVQLIVIGMIGLQRAATRVVEVDGL